MGQNNIINNLMIEYIITVLILYFLLTILTDFYSNAVVLVLLLQLNILYEYFLV